MRQPWLTRQAAEGGGPDKRALMGSADRQPTQEAASRSRTGKSEVTTLQLCYPQALSINIPMQCPEEREATRCCDPPRFQLSRIESIKSVETGIVTGRELLLAQESLAPALVRPRDSRPGYQVQGLRHPTARRELQNGPRQRRARTGLPL